MTVPCRIVIVYDLATYYDAVPPGPKYIDVNRGDGTSRQYKHVTPTSRLRIGKLPWKTYKADERYEGMSHSTYTF
jgi:hypothetical protein